MKLDRSDLYIVLLGIANWLLFMRFVSLFASGTAIWMIKNGSTLSTLLVSLFVLSFFVLFSNLARLVITFNSKEKEVALGHLGRTAKLTVALMFLYLVFTFVSNFASFGAQA